MDIIETPDTKNSKTILLQAPADGDIQFDIMETASEIAMDYLVGKRQAFFSRAG